MSIARTGRAEVVVDASPETVWQVVSDVTRTGDWSAECHQVRWLGDTTVVAPGARFRGRNRNGLIRWSRTCEVTSIAPPRELVWRTLPTPLYPDSTEWRITLEPTGDGTRIVQTHQVTKMPGWFEAIVSRTIPAHSDRTAALAADLARLGAVVDRAAEPRHAPDHGLPRSVASAARAAAFRAARPVSSSARVRTHSPTGT